MKSRSLSTKDIRQIIKSCRDNGVLEFKFDDLTLVLGTTAIVPKQSTPAQARANEQIQKLNEQQLSLLEEKEDVALMVIEDPLEMERRIADGELIDEVTEH